MRVETGTKPAIGACRPRGVIMRRTRNAAALWLLLAPAMPVMAQPALGVGSPPPAATSVAKPPIVMTAKPLKALQLSKVGTSINSAEHRA
ncbi:hypothetical protein, partial [Sandarakinorhabdus cyanobacteriorum]|uniref:hypothetical protein n=1 Tax=Sandarakinorhabdus cyanobacteriorum TaxID=1981098 RepID=UPI001A9C3BD0